MAWRPHVLSTFSEYPTFWDFQIMNEIGRMLITNYRKDIVPICIIFSISLRCQVFNDKILILHKHKEIRSSSMLELTPDPSWLHTIAFSMAFENCVYFFYVLYRKTKKRIPLPITDVSWWRILFIFWYSSAYPKWRRYRAGIINIYVRFAAIKKRSITHH